MVSRILLFVAAAAAALIGTLAVVVLLEPEPKAPQQTSQGTALIGGPFTLVDQDGRTRTAEEFRGRWLLVYFGYTHCPDVCPTELQRMGEALGLLGEDAEKVQPLFITVDPERDTVEQLKKYVGFFHPRLIGLTGSPEQVAAAAKAYRVYYAKAGEGEGYLMDHSGFIYLMSPEGKYVAHFRAGTSAEDMAAGIRRHLDGAPTAAAPAAAPAGGGG